MDVPLIESESSQYVAFIRDAQGLRALPRIGIRRGRLVRITDLRASIQLGMVCLVSENAGALLYWEFTTIGTHQHHRGGSIGKEAGKTTGGEKVT
jgi:hypothetical protein